MRSAPARPAWAGPASPGRAVCPPPRGRLGARPGGRTPREGRAGQEGGTPLLSAFCHKQSAKFRFLGTATWTREPMQSQQFQKRWTHLEQRCAGKLALAQKKCGTKPGWLPAARPRAGNPGFPAAKHGFRADTQTEDRTPRPAPALAQVMLSPWAGLRAPHSNFTRKPPDLNYFQTIDIIILC